MATVNYLEALLQEIRHIQDVAIVLLTLIMASVALRMYVRVWMTRRFGTEDWAMVLTFMLSVGHVGMAIAICSLSISLIHGDVEAYKTNTRLLRASGVTYVVTLMGLKVSLGYFFLSIFTYQRVQRTIIYIIMVSSAVLGTIYFPMASFTCAQVKVVSGSSPDCAIQPATTTMFIIFSAVNIASDFAFMLMAVGALFSANLPLITKLSTIMLLCLGSAGGVASIIRLVICLTPVSAAKYTEDNLNLLRWILIELGFSVIVTNLALTKPLFHAALIKIGLSDINTWERSNNSYAHGIVVHRVQVMEVAKVDKPGAENDNKMAVTMIAEEEEG